MVKICYVKCNIDENVNKRCYMINKLLISTTHLHHIARALINLLSFIYKGVEKE